MKFIILVYYDKRKAGQSNRLDTGQFALLTKKEPFVIFILERPVASKVPLNVPLREVDVNSLISTVASTFGPPPELKSTPESFSVYPNDDSYDRIINNSISTINTFYNWAVVINLKTNI
jgi:hypothetical protein